MVPRFDFLRFEFGILRRKAKNESHRDGFLIQATSLLMIKPYGFIKAWRAKIFAKIEWKDTSKNPTGSKNNSLSE